MNPLSSGKKLTYSIVPVLAILMCLGYGALIVLFMLYFGPFSRSFLAGINGPWDMLMVLTFIPLFLILFAIWFNYRFIRWIYGRPQVDRWAWRLNTAIVGLSCVLIGLSGLSVLVNLVSGSSPNNLLGYIPGAIMAGIMLYPYWLKKQLSSVLDGAESAAISPQGSNQPSAPLPSQPAAQPTAPQNPVPPSDTPTPQS